LQQHGVILTVRSALTACLALLLGAQAIAHADPKRPVPDYDGRGNPDSDGDSWELWIPRVVLSPVYVAHEYLIRRPLGALVTKAEREHWADSVEQIFTFGPNGNHVMYPTALFDFGMLPSVGIYYAGHDEFVEHNTLRVHVATWGRPWISATVADHYAFDRHHTLQARFDFRRSEDNIFFGIGPDVGPRTQSRYGLEKLEGTLTYHLRFPGESRFFADAGIHRIGFVDGTCCNDPSVMERVDAGQLPLPPGYGDSYTTAFGSLDLQLDTRSPKPEPGSGAYLHAYARPDADVHMPRAWMQYGGELGGAVDLTGRQRVLKMQLALGFVDPLQGTADQIPFTEYAVLGGELMPGFVPGWMTGRSTAAAQIGYTWPVWIGFDGQTRFTLGNAFGEHLAGLGPSNFRWSWDLGLTTNTVRDQGFELLFGLGSETFDQGGKVTSVRFAVGSRQGF
jgi:hypothetical protein